MGFTFKTCIVLAFYLLNSLTSTYHTLDIVFSHKWKNKIVNISRSPFDNQIPPFPPGILLITKFGNFEFLHNFSSLVHLLIASFVLYSFTEYKQFYIFAAEMPFSI